MERLTEKRKDGDGYRTKDFVFTEDVEEDGLLLKLPFPIGKPIYKVCYAKEINDGFVYETVMSLKFYADNIKDFENGIVYITKEAAEQALAEMQKEV